MKRTLKEHLDGLHERLKTLNSEFLKVESKKVANEIEAEMRTIKFAIGHYETALDIENRLLQSGKREYRSQ